MSELEEKLSGILNNPAMMQQIMGMAKMMSAQQPQNPPSAAQQPQNSPPTSQQPTKSAPSQSPGIDAGMVQALAGVLSKSGTDSHEQSLLCALQPYLSRDRIARLERAMNAARMAGAASSLLGSSGLTGR